MRLIDAEQMAVDESEAYMRAQSKITNGVLLEINRCAHEKIQRLIADTPIVDAVEVVRCNDCKHCIKSKLLCTHPRNRAFNTGPIVFPYHYCSYGERRCE